MGTRCVITISATPVQPQSDQAKDQHGQVVPVDEVDDGVVHFVQPQPTLKVESRAMLPARR